MRVLEESDIYIRFLELEDIDRGWLVWMNDVVITKQLYTSPPVSREQLVDVYETSQLPNAVMFAVCLRETDEYIGNLKISHFNWQDRKATIGRVLGKQEYHGRGYGRQITHLALIYGFYYLNLKRIQSGTWITHAASIRSNLKCGFKIIDTDTENNLVTLEITRDEFIMKQIKGASYV